MSKSLSTITRGIAALALSVAGLAVFTGEAGAATTTPTTVTTLAGSVTAATVGVPIVVSAVTTHAGSPAPASGAVTFTVVYNGAGSPVTVCAAVTATVTSPTVDTATCSWTPTAAGTAVITASVAAVTGTNGYNASTGATSSITVSKAAVTTAITVPGSVTTATVGVPITLTATQSNTADTGAVSFQVNYNSAGAAAISTACTSVAVTAGVATCSWTPTTAGTAVVTAVAVTDANYNASTGGTSSFAVTTIAAPTVGTATDTYGTGTITFTWTNPAQTLGVTGYSVVDLGANGSGLTFSTGTTLCTVSGSGIGGATNTCAYTGSAVLATHKIYVYSTNGTASAAASSSAYYTIAAPTAPTFTSATAGNGTVTFVYTETQDTLAPTKAVIKVASGSIICTTTSATTCTTTNAAAGLSNVTGDPVKFFLYVYNAVGSTIATPNAGGAGSDSGIAVTPANAPGAFTATAAVNYATGYVTVSWTAATGGLGTPTYTVGSTSSSHNYVCTTITATSCKIRIGDTTGGTVYNLFEGVPGGPFSNFLTVTATNSQGGQTATANTSNIYVTAQPDAPTETLAPAYVAGKMHISFTGIVNDSTSGISGYSVQLQTCTSTSSPATNCTASGSPVFIPASSPASAHYTYNLFATTQGLIYSYTVQAISTSSVFSIALQGSAVKYDISGPGDVTISAAQAIANPASATNSSFTATWTAPTSTGGSPIVGYDLVLISQCSSSSCSAGVAGTAVTAAATSTATSYTFTNLPAGFYGFMVKAINTATGVTGTGESTNWVTSAGAISVGNGGAALGEPTVTYPSATTVKFSVASLSGASTFKIANVGTSATVCTLTVVSGTGTCTVAASALGWTSTKKTFAAYSTDANGLSSLIGSAVTIDTPSVTYSSTNSYTGTNGQTVLWTATSDANVYGFNIIATDATTGATTTATKSGACTSGCTYLFTNLVAADTYTFQISAFNPATAQAYGTSALGASSGYVVTTGPAFAAAKPTVTGVVTTAATDAASGSSATVTWTGTPEATNATLTYTVTATSLATSSGSYAGGVVTTVVVPATATTATLTGLISGISYNYSVVANGYLSDSAADVLGGATTPTAVANPAQPSAPTGVTVTANAAGTTLTVKWTTPTNNGGAALYGYVVTATDAAGNSLSGGTCTATGQLAVFAHGLLTNTCTFDSGVQPKTDYTVSVVAFNAGAGNTAVNALAADLLKDNGSTNKTSSFIPSVTGTYLNALEGFCTALSMGVSSATDATHAGACAGALLTSSVAIAGLHAAWVTGGGGTAYDVTANAVTNKYVALALASGYSSVAGTATFTSPSTPGVPTGVTASVATGNVVTVSWTAPASNGGSAIVGYVVTATAGAITASSCTTSAGSTVAFTGLVITVTGVATTATCTFSSTTAAIKFLVQAVNSVTNNTTSNYSATSNSISTIQKPTAVANPVVANVAPTTSTGNGGIYVAWTASATTGIAATSYTVSIDAGTANAVLVTTTNTYYAFPAVSNATVHSIVVSAVNAAGATAAAPILNAAGQGLASAPSNPILVVSKQDTTSTLTPGYTLSWTAGASAAGSTVLPATYQVVGVNALNAVVVNQTTSATTLSLPYVAGEVFTVYQITAGGTSSGTPGTVYTNASVPGKPSFTSVATSAYSQVTGTETVTLICTASGTTGSAGTVTTTATVNGVTKDCTGGGYAFTGLAPNTAYSYSIVSTNAVGSSLAATGTVTTAPQVPGSPTSVASVLSTNQTTGEQYVTVSWAAPALNGGSAVTGYTVTWGTSGQYVCAAVLTGSSTSCTIDLGITIQTNNSAANFATVTAFNNVGPGTAATDKTVDPTSASAALIGTGADAPGSTIGFRGTATGTGTTSLTDSNATWVAGQFVGATLLVGTVSATITANDATSLTFDDGWVAADGYSPGATPGATSAFQINGTVIASVKSAGYGSLTVTWSETNTSGITITGYSVVATDTTATSATYGAKTTCTATGADATTCTLTGLPNDAFSIVVTPQTATQAFGTAAASAADTSWTGWIAPNVAAQVLGGASKVGGTASVLFNDMSVTAGAANSLPATKYTATAYTAAGKVAGTATCTASPCTVTGLANATTYTITVVPTNAVGAGSASSSVTVATLSSANPAAPTGVTAVRTANGLTVSWTAPATIGSAAQLVGYWVSATDTLTGQQNTCPYNATYGVLLAPSVSCSITGLSVGNNYTVAVTAIAIDGAMNKLLSAAATKAVEYTTLSPEPVITTFLAVTAKQKSVSALSGTAKSALNNLISVTNDGAKITVTGYGTTKAIALARANAAANYLFNNGAAVHITIKTVISRTIKTALVTVTSN